MRNLKEEFNNLVKDIKILLKENGFKTKASNFSKKINDIEQTFDIQKSRWNSAESISFTFNIGFFSKDIYEAVEGHSVPDFPKPHDCAVSLRSGNLVYKKDEWFELNNETSLDNLKKEIKKVLDITMDFFSKHQTLVSLEDVFNTYNFSPFNQVVFLLKINKKSEAEILLKKVYKDALIPKSSTMTTTYKGETLEEIETVPAVNKDFLKHVERFAEKNNINLK